MQIQKVIDKLKAYHKGEWEGKQIDEETTRDKVLYGNPYQECTGIVTTCWATIDVIKKAALQGANLIIAHEALFWNHGDHTDWLQEEENSTFLAKKKLLDETGIVVWRNHDYIHSGIPLKDGSFTDGIFYGVASKLGWIPYITKAVHNPMSFTIPKTTVQELADFLIQRLRLNGVKIIGNKNSIVERVRIPFHVLGDARDTIQEADREDINCFLTMEIVDFTLAEYIRDSSMLGMDRAIIGMGHFNLEEPGMEYMTTYLPAAIQADIPCSYIQSGDMYAYITK